MLFYELEVHDDVNCSTPSHVIWLQDCDACIGMWCWGSWSHL